jgi:hypothetical protein
VVSVDKLSYIVTRFVRLDLNPVIDLSSISDDMVNNEEGFSFALYPRNKLDMAYLQLVH